MRALAIALLLAGCGAPSIGNDAGVAVDGGVIDAIAYVRCGSYCVRPTDCLVGFPDDELCPAGFLCASLFVCGDGGTK
jgi:hypothetical protein